MEVEKFVETLDRIDAAEYLPYFDYEDGIFILNDGGIGIAVECLPAIVPSHDLYSNLESLLSSTVPEDSAVQFIFTALHDYEFLIDTWKANKYPDSDLLKETMDSFARFLESKKLKPITKRFFNTTAKNYRLVVTLKVGGKQKEFSIFDYVKNPIKFLTEDGRGERQELENRIKNLLEIKDKFVGGLKKAFGYAKQMDADDLIRFVYVILNQKHDFRNIPRWDGSNISDFCIANDTVIDIEDKCIKVDGVYGKSLSIKEYPERWSFASVLEYIGDAFGNNNHEIPFMIVLNAIKLGDAGKNAVRKSASIVLSQKLPEGLFPKLAFKQRDLEYGMERIEKGVDLFHINLSIFIFSDDKEKLFLETGKFQGYFKTLGFTLEEDVYINFPVLLSNLPFGYDHVVKDFLKRGRVIFIDNTVTLAPVVSDWKGYPSPEVIFFTPRGQPVGFDLFATSQGGYNASVIGTTGAGKSVLLEYIALMYRMAGDRVWIIDIGRSYEQFAKAFDGEFIEFRSDKPICLNPFSEIKNDEMFNEDRDFLKDFFCMLGLPKNKEVAETLIKWIKSQLSIALERSWKKYGNESCVDTVLDELSKISDDPRIKDFITTADIYRTGREYGEFFNGKANISFNKDIVVLENDDLENKPDLRSPVMMLINYHISKEIFLNKDKTRRNIVIIDEAHKFLGEPMVDLFVEQAYRRFRKHKASIILGTQGFDDFFGGDGNVSRAGRVIVENSKYIFFGIQQEVSMFKVKDYFKMKDGDFVSKMFDSVSSGYGEYSEFFIWSKDAKTKVRLVLDDFMKVMFFTEKEIRARIKNLVEEEGYSWSEAVKKVMEEIR